MKYPAKLLLFGEHTVNLGSQALAIPLWRFGGQWRFLPAAKMHERAERQMRLPQFAQHLLRLRQMGALPMDFALEKFEEDLAAGLVFESDIPTGYGAGSSGALVAAVFGRYGMGQDLTGFENLSGLKRTFAQMESFFHGTSSGTDPLVCYLQQPVLLSKTEVKPVPPSNHESRITYHEIFLLDTRTPRQAGPLIEYFLEKNQDAAFRKQCESALLPAVDAGIAAYLGADGEKLMQEVHRIGEFQLRFLEKLIPAAFRPIWQAGLAGNFFKLKVCGAGGGGFILGVTRDFEKLEMAYPNFRFLKVDEGAAA